MGYAAYNRNKKRGAKSEFNGLAMKGGLEPRVASSLEQAGLPVNYEPDKLKYEVPATIHNYSPDFKIAEYIYLESKGFFSDDDRKKMVLVKRSHPEVTIYILFQDGYKRIRKSSKTTYLDWAKKNGFEAACMKEHKGIPLEWIREWQSHHLAV